MTRLVAFLAALVCLSAGAAQGQDRRFTLAVPPALEASGVLSYLLPRFSLKTRIGIDVEVRADAAQAPGSAHAVLADGPVAAPEGAPEAVPAFRAVGGGAVWRIRRMGEAGPEGSPSEFAWRFEEWLVSEIGLRTVAAYAPEGEALFEEAGPAEEEVAAVVYEGDAVEGERLSLVLCGRCHVVGPQNRMAGLGSTPSFGALKALADWEGRFLAFYALNPHPSFTQVEDVTLAFDPTRPPPIVPIEMTLDDLDAIMAFVSAIAPLDLGAPVEAR